MTSQVYYVIIPKKTLETSKNKQTVIGLGAFNDDEEIKAKMFM